MKKKLLQACYVPQMKAENMYNSYSGIKNRIFKEKFFFFEMYKLQLSNVVFTSVKDSQK